MPLCLARSGLLALHGASLSELGCADALAQHWQVTMAPMQAMGDVKYSGRLD